MCACGQQDGECGGRLTAGCWLSQKGEKKAARVNDIVTREYTINLHKRLMGMYVPRKPVAVVG